MKYLKTKQSRRKGVAIELAMMLLMVMTAMSIMTVSTTMILINKQKDSKDDLTEIVDEIKKMEYDNVGKYFKQLVYIELNEENNSSSELQYSYINEEDIKTSITTQFNDLFTTRGLTFDVIVSRTYLETDLGTEESSNSETTTKTFYYTETLTLTISDSTNVVYELTISRLVEELKIITNETLAVSYKYLISIDDYSITNVEIK